MDQAALPKGLSTDESNCGRRTSLLACFDHAAVQQNDKCIVEKIYFVKFLPIIEATLGDAFVQRLKS